ncbi:MAG: M10 family metallopeptidase [Paracoccaceae bacterium]
MVNQITKYGWGVPSVLRHDERSGDTMTVNIANLTADGQKLALWALEAWEQASGLNFVTTTSSGADILFDDESAGAFAGPNSYYPSNGQIIQSTVNVSKAWLSTYGHSLDSYSMLTYIHEIGHALGLAHAGPYDGSASFPSDALFRNDSYQMTVMSYFNTATNTAVNASYGLPVTAMLADISAMRALYGHPGTVQGGNTVWGANSNVTGYMGQLMGFLFDGDALDPAVYTGGPVMFTIQDTGGWDTLDFSTGSFSQRIDLRQGYASNIGGSIGNVLIAMGSIIEHAIGGSGQDRIIGNYRANQLTGGRGNDTINGGSGTDRVFIADSINDIDVVKIGSKVRITSADGIDEVFNVEKFTFDDATLSLSSLIYGSVARQIFGTSGANSLTGGYKDDKVYGGAGNDYVSGFFGDDTVSGGSGNDRAYGSYGNDTVYGSSGNDYVMGNDGDDSLNGGTGHDNCYGGDGNDVANGMQGNDRVYGDDGNDTVYGSSGDDTVNGGAGNDQVFGNDDDDNVNGWTGNDTVDGGNGNDTVFGSYGDDVVHGGAGNDAVFGNDGADELYGDAGNDTLTGGAGADEFVFAAVAGERDVVTDFEDGVDHIEIRDASGVGVFSVTGGTELRFDGHVVFLEGILAGDIDGSDYLLV